MYIERYGNGPIHMVGLHGWSGDHRTFEPILASLPARYTFWSVDLPGCGKSPAPAQWTFAAIARELEIALAKIPAPLHLVGNCSGAIFALAIAPALRVTKITMIDAFAFWPWYFKIFLVKGWGRYAYLAAFANPLGRWLANLSLAKRRTSDTNLTDGFSRVDHAVTYRYLQVLDEIQSLSQFSGIEVPIHIVCGEKSFAAVRNSTAIWQRIFPHAKAFELTGAGHLPIREATLQMQQMLFEE